MTKRVIAAYQERGSDGRNYPVSVTDDGQHWLYDGSNGTWCKISLPLPPEALGEVADEIKVGDSVQVVGTVQGVAVDSRRVNLGGHVVWLPAKIMTKVPR